MQPNVIKFADCGPFSCVYILRLTSDRVTCVDLVKHTAITDEVAMIQRERHGKVSSAHHYEFFCNPTVPVYFSPFS